jgi:hypothetical protein
MRVYLACGVSAKLKVSLFDSLMHAAQNRRIALLREINIRRELGIKIKSLRNFG